MREFFELQELQSLVDLIENPHWWQINFKLYLCSTRYESHFGHSKRLPHFLHKVKGAYPRLFKKIRACSLFDNDFFISPFKASDIHS